MTLISIVYFFACAIIIEKHLLPKSIYELSGLKTLLISFLGILCSVLLSGISKQIAWIVPGATIFFSLLIINKYNGIKFLHFGGQER